MSIDKLDTQVRQEQITQADLNLISANGLKGLSVAGVAKRIVALGSGPMPLV
jgi:hypothetical protein